MDKTFYYTLGKKHGGGGSGGGGANKVDVFKEHKITGFAPNSNYNGAYASVYVFGVDGAEAFQLRVGENYTVVWDEEEHKVTAQDGSALISGSVLLGNASFLHPGLSGNNEPFLFGWTSKGCTFGSVDSTLEAHDVRIYQTVFENAESPSVALDFTNGNQIIRPSEDGKVLSNLTIEKPDDLLPENILKDKNIGGVTGIAEKGSSVKVAMGTFTSTITSATTVRHNLGVIPDVVIIKGVYAANTANNYLTVGFSQAFNDYTGSTIMARVCGVTTVGGAPQTTTGLNPIENTYNTSPIYYANKTQFYVGASSSMKIASGSYWIAIAGLI